MIPWEIQAREFVNCNCGYACPCHFNELPTHGRCEAAGAVTLHSNVRMRSFTQVAAAYLRIIFKLSALFA
ncbi:DUF1326 domain-containing protein [Methylocystis sp. FS]|uniref:DUF1326 domain-containing protein n=1 Tax=Methylocystis silviterrae TaxID=2743612 RepID=UPI00158369ED|nr:DUF1326 domain-containing protein [Methylocystis silviterrae]NUJ81405.1 DUF1326 domain-containing protein [Methylocystis silviterrae]